MGMLRVRRSKREMRKRKRRIGTLRRIIIVQADRNPHMRNALRWSA